MRICFLVGSMAISGGTYVIVEHASHLQAEGHQVTLAVQEPFTAATLSWHDKAPRLRCVAFPAAMGEEFDLVVATWWKTALEMGSFRAERYAYFVQSIESRFYPESEAPLRALVDATYRMPVSYVTEAGWIRDHLGRQGHSAALVPNGIRKDVYYPTDDAAASRARRATPRILVEGHFGVAFKNTALSIRLARRAGARDIWLLTGSPVRWVPKVRRVFSQVPMVETASIYRSCDVLVKLSTVEGMFGPPLEMFHCGGTSIVFDVSGHDEYIRDGVNGLVARSGDLDGVVMHIQTLLDDRAMLERLQDGARQTAAQWPDWVASSSRFSEWVTDVVSRAPTDPQAIAAIAESAWGQYRTDEGRRLALKGKPTRRQRLSAAASRLPDTLVRTVKGAEAVGEVLFGGKKAY